MIEINLLEWDGGQAELGLMLWISEHGEEKPFLPVSFLHLNLKEVILTFFSEEPREYFYQVPGDWGFFSWPESSLLVSRVSQHCYNLFPVKFLVINLKLQTLPYWVAVKLWKWSLSFRNLPNCRDTRQNKYQDAFQCQEAKRARYTQSFRSIRGCKNYNTWNTHPCRQGMILECQAYSCPTLCKPTDHSPPGSSDHGTLQARILEWVAVPSTRGASWHRDQTHTSYISCLGRWVLHH